MSINVENNLQALWAISRSVAETANNVANVNSVEFKSARVDLEDGPGGQGVQTAAVFEDPSAGPLEPAPPGLPEAILSEKFPGFVEGSNTDLATEFVRLTRDELAYKANATVIRLNMETEDNVLDELITGN